MYARLIAAGTANGASYFVCGPLGESPKKPPGHCFNGHYPEFGACALGNAPGY